MKNIILFACYIFNIAVYGQKWEWSRKATNTTAKQVATKVCTDRYANVYILGSNSGQAFYDTSVISSGNFIAKYNATGTIQWAHHIGGGAGNIAADGNGNVYVLGSIDTNTVHLTKYNSAGQILWEKSYGGNSKAWAYAMAVNLMGTVYITGTYRGDSITFDSHTLIDTTYEYHFFIAQISPLGITNWISKGLTDHSTGYYSNGRILRLDKKGNIYVVVGGSACIGYGCGGAFLAKFDSLGNLSFSKFRWGSYADVAGLAIDDSMNIYAIYNRGSHYGYEAGLAKYDSLMNMKWLMPLDSTYGVFSLDRGLSIDSLNNLYITGGIGDDWNNIDSVLIAHQWVQVSGLTDVIVVKIDPARNYSWIKTAGGQNLEYPRDLAVNQDGVCYVVGDFNLNHQVNYNDTMMFDDNSLPNDGAWSQIFVAKITADNFAMGLQSISKNEKCITVYPNPSSGIFRVGLNSEIINANINVYDLLGKCLLTKKIIDENKCDMDLRRLPKGIYFMEIISEGESVTKKIVLQ